MADNMVTLVGTLGADPEVRRTTQGKDVVNFTLVTNDRIRNADGSWSDGAASWFRVAAWNQLGRNAAMSFRKGQRVIVRGALKVEQWQAKDGGTGRTVLLTASSLGHDLLWGTSSFARGASGTAARVEARPPEQADEQDGTQDRGTWAPVADTGAERSEERSLQPAWATPMSDDEVPF